MAAPIFILIRPDGFVVDELIVNRLIFVLVRNTRARKLWLVENGCRYLACFSSDGSSSADGKPCARCPARRQCQEKLRLFFKFDGKACCLELPASSWQNYRKYVKRLKARGVDIRKTLTLARSFDRGYWGEVQFDLAPLQCSWEP